MRKIIFLAIIIILIGGCSKDIENNSEKYIPLAEQKAIPEEELIQETPENDKDEPRKDAEPVEQAPSWKNVGVAISGKYADADIIELGSGNYRMYYSAEPETPGFKGQVYSSISANGISWNKESGERMEWAIFPSVIKLSNGKYRMYFQNAGVIKSAISDDGMSWSQEPGVRVDTTNSAGLRLENVAAPTVIKVEDEYIMAYRGTINEKFPAKVPNENTQLFFWANSKDGLTFEKKGIALDSRNDEFKGLLDGSEFVKWDNGIVRLYFWSYKGIYHVVFSNGKFSDAEFDFTTASEPKTMFPENPPGDPTLIKISNRWFLYYGQHGKGIFYAILEDSIG